jgi:glucosamine-6-phosphate deaminase
MKTHVFKTTDELFDYLVSNIYTQSKHANLNIGLATGNTMLEFYSKLLDSKIKLEEQTYFLLDELLGISLNDPRSYTSYLHHKFFSKIKNRVKFITPRSESTNDLKQYEKEINDCGGIHIQLLGIGINGHVGLNEPGCDANSRTRVVDISSEIQNLYKPIFPEGAPTKAITMGIQNLQETRHIVLIAIGKNKAQIMKKFFEVEMTPDLPASLLKNHKNFEIYLDTESASLIENLSNIVFH